MYGMTIAGTGKMLPEKVVTNDDLSELVDTSDEWIKSRTGIATRYFCSQEKNWELAVGAAKKAIENAGIRLNEIGACIVATFTPDYATPSVACMLQKELGISEDIPSFDINAACSGFIYALRMASGLFYDQERPYTLIVGSEQISTRLDMTDRGTCVLFGDGAGAVVIKKDEHKKFHCILGASGDQETLGCPGYTSERPYIYMDGQKVFKFAVSTILQVVQDLLDKNKLSINDIDYVVCHQANERIIKNVIHRLDANEKQFYMNVQKYGNTSAASIPIVLAEMNENNMFKQGMKIICVGFGAGLTWGGALIEL